MLQLTMLVALAATAQYGSCPGGTCGASAYTYAQPYAYTYQQPAYQQPAAYSYASYYYAPRANAVAAQPAPAAFRSVPPTAPAQVQVQAQPQPAAYAQPAPAYYYPSYYYPAYSPCAGGNCARR